MRTAPGQDGAEDTSPGLTREFLRAHERVGTQLGHDRLGAVVRPSRVGVSRTRQWVMTGDFTPVWSAVMVALAPPAVPVMGWDGVVRRAAGVLFVTLTTREGLHVLLDVPSSWAPEFPKLARREKRELPPKGPGSVASPAAVVAVHQPGPATVVPGPVNCPSCGRKVKVVGGLLEVHRSRPATFCPMSGSRGTPLFAEM